MGDGPVEPDFSEFVEVDPTGRYGRYSEILGKGSSKTVYRAFDEYEGIEVAWNQVKLHDFLQSPEELERLYCEIHLLKTLKHKNIMKFYISWVDTSKRNINFVTEMFTSGTLRQYRQKHRRVNLRAVKHWCRQILRGLLYLHSHDPPVIHRDLKCDNIFINGNQGEVKIGDLGLAAFLRKSHAAHCVGTPEFMAPEVYEEEYNELVDIYSFGMCILEMVTLEYPYSECSHPVQIYKKVISGTKPEALYKVKDPEVRQFVEKCLVTASRRLPARELLKDPFLQIDDCGSGTMELDGRELGSLLRQPLFSPSYSNGSFLPRGSAKQRSPGTAITKIYFRFDVEADTALSVATEMVGELDITDHDVTMIAEMIDSEMISLVPEWQPGVGITEDAPGHPAPAVYHNCASNVSSVVSLLDLAPNTEGAGCSRHESAPAMHGRFEEITYRVDGPEHSAAGGPPGLAATRCTPGEDLPASYQTWRASENPPLMPARTRRRIPGDQAELGILYPSPITDTESQVLPRLTR
ncbi:unnamed protein product [Spirodela intermedia]|uniref:non-specific serine/threonine protein kinase n=1 Tax=Spirodela intermedia TaxID=51605 RepID=A0A7I8IMV9_SPIIN|nr:unnamed protein product [Spirodela intermedia]CAA6659100.1 unnamed protein product [Spirodela intermedia]